MLEENFTARFRKRHFRFEAKWVLEDERGGIIEAACERSSAALNPLKEVQGNLKKYNGDLTRWSCQKDRD